MGEKRIKSADANVSRALLQQPLQQEMARRAKRSILRTKKQKGELFSLNTKIKSFPLIKNSGTIKPLWCISRKARMGLLRTGEMCEPHVAQVHVAM